MCGLGGGVVVLVVVVWVFLKRVISQKFHTSFNFLIPPLLQTGFRDSGWTHLMSFWMKMLSWTMATNGEWTSTTTVWQIHSMMLRSKEAGRYSAFVHRASTYASLHRKCIKEIYCNDQVWRIHCCCAFFYIPSDYDYGLVTLQCFI